jgi:hypothetical protein
MNGIGFILKFIWYSFIRDTFLIFEQFFYVGILSGSIPGSIYLAEWIQDLVK